TPPVLAVPLRCGRRLAACPFLASETARGGAISMTKEYYRNRVFQGDCVDVMQGLPSNFVDFVLTDPPYLMNYRPRGGQTVLDDNQADWLVPSAVEMYRLLRRDSLCVSFYGWQAADLFIDAWRKAGF